jgi:two-component system sensor histidine kinase ChvG
MSLRVQLLALVALTLLLPWAGLEMVRQVEISARSGLEASLVNSARAYVAVTELARNAELRRWSPGADNLSERLYVHLLTRPPLLDGFAGEWNYVRDQSDSAFGERAEAFADGTRFWFGAADSSYLYFFIDVIDDDVVYQRIPGAAPHGDRVVLVFGSDDADRSALLLATAAPGGFRAQRTTGMPAFTSTGEYEDRVTGRWQSTQRGYAIEARIPFRLVGSAIGIGVVDSDEGGSEARLSAWTWGESGAPNRLVRESTALNNLLRPFAGGEDRLRIIDAEGWVLADSGSTSPQPENPTSNPSVFEPFFRYFLKRNDPERRSQESQPGRIADPIILEALNGMDATAWYRQGSDASGIVTAAVPVSPAEPGLGALLLEQASDPIVTTTNLALMRVMGTAVLIILIASAAMLAYASFLSFRVGRLSRAVESALGPRGEIDTRLPGTKGRDELGDLARSFESLLARLREYTDYLKSLKSKLSHELRTPLAVVSTSLENLEQEQRGAAGQDEYLARLKQGTARLESILQAMTAATRVEQAIADSEPGQFDIVAVVDACVSAYADVYTERSFSIDLPEVAVNVEGSAELIAQMLDKLIDNAVEFSPVNSSIDVRIVAKPGGVVLSVSNRGPLLPQSMKHQLFDSLVSVRHERSEKPHLGLGLYIVMLIAEFHGGNVEASDLPDGSGVLFRVDLPRSDTGSA